MCESLHIQHKEQSYGMMCEIRKMFESKLFTDVIIVAGQEEFYCHKIILAASSAYFKTMFSNSFKETIDSRVCFDSLSPWSMKSIIDFVYTGECRVSIPHIQELLQAAAMLEYPVLVNQCAELIANSIDIDNCFAVLSLAMIIGIASLEHKARTYIRKNFTQIGQSSFEWLNMDVENVIECISDPLIDVRSERNVWNAVIRWINHDVDYRISHLISLFNHIRLNQLDNRFIQKELQDNHIIRRCAKSQQLLQAHLDIEKSPAEDISFNNQLPHDFNQTQAIRPSTVRKPCLVLLGGMDHGILNRVDSFNPHNNQWASLATMPENNVMWFSCCVLEKKIYITGGIKAGTILDRVYMYDPNNDAWCKRSCMLESRAKHSSASIESCMYVCGGIYTPTFNVSEDGCTLQNGVNSHNYRYDDSSSNGSPAGPLCCPSIDVYDESTDQWTRLITQCKSPRIDSCLVPVLEKKYHGDPDEPITTIQWYLYEIGGCFENGDSTDQISIFRVDQPSQELSGEIQNKNENDNNDSVKDGNNHIIEALDYYIKLPFIIRHAKCAVDQTRATVYIFCELTGKLARLNIKTNSIHFMPENPHLLSFPRYNTSHGDDNSSSNNGSNNHYNVSNIHCSLAYMPDSHSLILLAGSNRCESSVNSTDSSYTAPYSLKMFQMKLPDDSISSSSRNSHQQHSSTANINQWTNLIQSGCDSSNFSRYNNSSGSGSAPNILQGCLERTLFGSTVLEL